MPNCDSSAYIHTYTHVWRAGSDVSSRSPSLTMLLTAINEYLSSPVEGSPRYRGGGEGLYAVLSLLYTSICCDIYLMRSNELVCLLLELCLFHYHQTSSRLQKSTRTTPADELQLTSKVLTKTPQIPHYHLPSPEIMLLLRPFPSSVISKCSPSIQSRQPSWIRPRKNQKSKHHRLEFNIAQHHT